MTVLTCETLPATLRVDLLLLERLRRRGQMSWSTLNRVAGPEVDHGQLAVAATLLARDGVIESSRRVIGAFRLPQRRAIEIVLDEHLVDSPPDHLRCRVRQRLRQPVTDNLHHAVDHDVANTLHTVAAICCPEASTAEVAAAAWTAHQQLRCAPLGLSSDPLLLCATALRLRTASGDVAELYRAAAGIVC